MSDSSNFIARSFWSLMRLLSRLMDKPKENRPAHHSLFPQSFLFYLIWLLYLVGVWKLMVLYDDDISRWARGLAGDSPNLQRMFVIFTTLGSTAWILIPTLISGLGLSVMRWNVATSESVRKRIRRLAGWYSDINFLFFTVLMSGVLVYLLKNTIGRARPKFIDTLGHLSFDFGAFQSDLASFPSGHATTFGAFCMGFALLFPRYKWLFLAAAIIGALSRVMVLAHYPSDVLAGVALGGGFVWISARYLARRDLMFRFSNGWLPTRKR